MHHLAFFESQAKSEGTDKTQELLRKSCNACKCGLVLNQFINLPCICLRIKQFGRAKFYILRSYTLLEILKIIFALF